MGGNIKVSTEAEGVTVTLESGKLNFSLTDKAMENIKEGLKLTVKFKSENEMDYENNPTVLNLNVKSPEPAGPAGSPGRAPEPAGPVESPGSPEPVAAVEPEPAAEWLRARPP